MVKIDAFQTFDLVEVFFCCARLCLSINFLLFFIDGLDKSFSWSDCWFSELFSSNAFALFFLSELSL